MSLSHRSFQHLIRNDSVSRIPNNQNPHNFLKKKTKLSLENAVSELQGTDAVSLVELKQLFVESAGNSTANHIEKDAFLRLLSERLNEKNSQILSKIFEALDTNGDSRISFVEYISAASLFVKGDLDEKCRFIFETADANGDGEISKDELVSLLLRLHQAPKVLEDIAKEYNIHYSHSDTSSEEGMRNIVDSFFQLYKADNDESTGLNSEQFSQLIKKNPKLLMLLTSKMA